MINVLSIYLALDFSNLVNNKQSILTAKNVRPFAGDKRHTHTHTHTHSRTSLQKFNQKVIKRDQNIIKAGIFNILLTRLIIKFVMAVDCTRGYRSAYVTHAQSVCHYCSVSSITITPSYNIVRYSKLNSSKTVSRLCTRARMHFRIIGIGRSGRKKKSSQPIELSHANERKTLTELALINKSEIDINKCI